MNKNQIFGLVAALLLAAAGFFTGQKFGPAGETPALQAAPLPSWAREVGITPEQWQERIDVAFSVAPAKAAKNVDPSSSLALVVRELPADPPFPPSTFIQYPRSKIPTNEVHVVQFRPTAADDWMNAFEAYDPLIFTFHPIFLRTYGQPVGGYQWRTVKVE
jgi:hypothetical protein